MDARYSRQIVLPGFGVEAQSRLATARVLVIGAGGLGSSVIPALAAAGVGRIGIIDDDSVELSNLHRQLAHTSDDVGRPKAQSAAQTVSALNPETRVDVIEGRLSSANALELFADYDLAVDGSDNFPTRYLANDAAALTGIPLVWGAVSQYDGQVGVAWATRGPQYRDLFPTPPPPDSVLSCETGGVFPATVAVIGSLMTAEVLKLLTDVGTPLIGRVTIFDALTGAFRSLDYGRDPLGAGITELIDYDLFCGITDTLSPRQLAARRDEFVLVDVREPWEAAIASLPGAVLVPLDSLDAAEFDLATPVVVYCHHGIRSATARARLAARGITASHLAGGIDAWSREIDPTLPRY